MRVLVACEFSGIVRDAFAAKGHDAWSCDLLPSERNGNHLQMDVEAAIELNEWDFIGLHLPCTAIALCGNSTYGQGMKKHSERLASIKWTKNVYDKACSVCDAVYFENPKNVMGKFIGKRSQAIHPFQFGHLERKETWLWLHGLPKLIGTKDVYSEMMLLPKNVRERLHYMPPSESRGHERSRTYTGIANAMADQWSNVNELKQAI